MLSSVTLALEPNVPERFVERRAMCHPEKLTHGQQDTVHLQDKYTAHRNSRRDSSGTSEAERTSPWEEALCQRQQPKAPSLDEEDSDEPLPSAQLLGFLTKTRMSVKAWSCLWKPVPCTRAVGKRDLYRHSQNGPGSSPEEVPRRNTCFPPQFLL